MTQAKFSVTYNVNSTNPPYVLSVKKQGDDLERWISGGTNSSGDVIFNSDASNAIYNIVISKVGCNSGITQIPLDCTVITPAPTPTPIVVPTNCVLSVSISNISCNNTPVITPVIAPVVTPIITPVVTPIITPVVTPISQTIVITQPVKPQYFFSDGRQPSDYNDLSILPAIFQNANDYDIVNDLVWLKNNEIKIGINLKRGGQIAWASLIDDTKNLVYNGYDGGFQITLDAYQKRDGYNQNGKYSRSRYDEVGQSSPNPNFIDGGGNVIPLTSYNTTQGGDFRNFSQSLIAYYPVLNGFYTKIRPLFYTLDREFSRTYIEATYTLDGYAVKCDYKYTSFRNDGQYLGGGFDGGHAPVCFLVNNLSNYKSYVGNNPWTRNTNPSQYNANIEDGLLPNETLGGTPITKNVKEHWSLVYNRDNNKTIGIYANTNEVQSSFGLKQKEVYPMNGNARSGKEFSDGYTILGRNFDIGTGDVTQPITNRDNYNTSISSYLIITPDTNTFIDTVYRVSGH